MGLNWSDPQMSCARDTAASHNPGPGIMVYED
jgi:hypothetical protein